MHAVKKYLAPCAGGTADKFDKSHSKDNTINMRITQKTFKDRGAFV